MFQNYDEMIMPVEEMMNYEEFTDRVEILRMLDGWIKGIKKMISGSTAIMSPRRMGKTSLLDRLVNTVFFKDYSVAPFYFKMKREEITLKEFLLEYAITFFRQYIAYCLKDPGMYDDTSLKLENLLSIETSNTDIAFAKYEIESFLNRYNSTDYKDARSHWEAFIKVPERIASRTNTRVAIIIDEFQDMKFYIYPIDIIPEDKSKLPAATDLTATYDRQSQSRKAPMLVSGSAVTLVFKTIMGGPLGGRFEFIYLKPLSIVDGATLITKLLEQLGEKISEENAIYISSEVMGHPYYLYCCATSLFENKNFDTKEDINKLIEYETRKGKIFGFWETHFANNKQYINNDNDIQLGKKIIYYLTKYNNQPVGVEEIAQKLKVSKSIVEEKIDKLYLADLVYKSDFKYYTFNDIILMKFIQYRFEKDIEDIEKVDLKEQGIFNVAKGKYLELIVESIMSKFGHRQELEGRLLGVQNKILVPVFRYVGNKTIQPDSSRMYQIDVYGEWEQIVDGQKLRGLWVVECKHRKKPMTKDEVEKAIEASHALLHSQYREPDTVQLKVWVVSTGGFAPDALEILKGSDVFYSGYDEISELFKLYGGIKIPIFE